MEKYCDYFFTTKIYLDLKIEHGDTQNGHAYSWHIMNEKGEELQSSLSNEDGERFYDSKEVAEQQAKEAIQDHYV